MGYFLNHDTDELIPIGFGTDAVVDKTEDSADTATAINAVSSSGRSVKASRSVAPDTELNANPTVV